MSKWPRLHPPTPEWVEFIHAQTEADEAPPCTNDLRFTSDDPEDRRAAAEWCEHCPLARLCRAAAVSSGEIAGVWGGIDYTPTTKKETS